MRFMRLMFIVASPLEWFHGIGTPAPQSRPLCSHLCCHAVPEWQFSEICTAPGSLAPLVLSRDHRKCAHCLNNTRTHAHPGRSGALKGASACYKTQC